MRRVMSEDIGSHYRVYGYAILRGAYDQERVARLMAICDRVLEQWRRAPQTDNPPVGPQSNYMRHLNHPEYHRESPGELAYLLDSVAAPRLIEAVKAALGEEFVFSATSLYFNPTGASEDGFWHKDSLGEWPDPRDKETGIGVSVQIALAPSDDFELVPGSHARDYTDAERRICVDDDRAHNRSNEMPNAAKMVLSRATRCCSTRSRCIAGAITPTSRAAPSWSCTARSERLARISPGTGCTSTPTSRGSSSRAIWTASGRRRRRGSADTSSSMPQAGVRV